MRILNLYVAIALLVFSFPCFSKVYNQDWAVYTDISSDARITNTLALMSGNYINVALNNPRHFMSYTFTTIKRKPLGEKMIVVDPRSHTWKAYTAEGKVLRSGMATAGSGWCGDIGRPCRTKTGVFRIYSLGGSDCISHKFPVGRGGAPMPYCMFFNGGQGLHGSYQVVAANVSHGCVRLHVGDARWIRYNFAGIGTKVVIKPY